MEGIRDKVGASKGVGALSLLASDLLAGLWGLASSSCSLVGLVGGLLQGLRRIQNPRAIVMEL